MNNTQSIKAALISQIIESGTNIPLGTLTGNIDLLIKSAELDGFTQAKEIMFPTITKPELKAKDLKAGEWYVFKTKRTFNNDKGFLSKFDYILNDCIYCSNNADLDGMLPIFYGKSWLCNETDIKSIRHATREEIVKYFPNEFEIDTHGGNDISQLTDHPNTI
jgi:hypothetical protein